MQAAKILLRIVGCFAIVVATLGLWYNLTSLSASYRMAEMALEIPYFYQAYYIMSAICVACFALLLLCGGAVPQAQDWPVGRIRRRGAL